MPHTRRPRPKSGEASLRQKQFLMEQNYFHRGRSAQRLVNPDEVVPDRVQRDYVAVVLEFL
jgi:hypothetical protein